MRRGRGRAARRWRERRRRGHRGRTDCVDERPLLGRISNRCTGAPPDRPAPGPYAPAVVSAIFQPDAWEPVAGFDLKDITYHRAVDHGTVRVAFDRPEVRNAFRPGTVDELYRVLDHARMTPDVGCVLLTGNGPSPKDGVWSFCSGGDQRIRGKDGYKYADGDDASSIDPGAHRPAAHPRGAAADPHHAEGRHLRRARAGRPGGGHWLHVVCDLTLASREHGSVQADRCRCRELRRWLRLRLPRPSGRAEVRPGDLLPRRRVLGR